MLLFMHAVPYEDNNMKEVYLFQMEKRKTEGRQIEHKHFNYCTLVHVLPR